MIYVVTEPCIGCKHTECVDVCPVDCFHEGENFMVIDPEVCIGCAACEPVCPTDAIFGQEDVPDQWRDYVELNAKYAQEWPGIFERTEPLPEAQQWMRMDQKRKFLVTKALEPQPRKGAARR